ncbi:MAG: hypothetical protein NTV58_07255 [Deltaproteobacteria bacterium]|nr:hypothetical protein [Deltaproteobacteria bacterium]
MASGILLNRRILPAGPANNSYILPCVGLGILASEASRITDEFFAADARDQDNPAEAKRTRLDCPPPFNVPLNILRFHQILRPNESFHAFPLCSPINLIQRY